MSFSGKQNEPSYLQYIVEKLLNLKIAQVTKCKDLQQKMRRKFLLKWNK
jgi:Tat protein secretion system quality control protein TatD with DNase activity